MRCRVDLAARTIAIEGSQGIEGVAANFAIDDHTRRCLLEGLDDIGLTL